MNPDRYDDACDRCGESVNEGEVLCPGCAENDYLFGRYDEQREEERTFEDYASFGERP